MDQFSIGTALYQIFAIVFLFGFFGLGGYFLILGIRYLKRELKK
ncbi:hypothetical protein CAY60_000440 [Shouchella clausii]|uniref:DUF3149 domain-containing protein n=1 Tax=Shouchella rhizosphaerae TaxID=866786 RepID=A0ABZ2CWJ9_9BACI|nr:MULTISPECIES: hypothetical protein [Shouchella]ALA53514.1 hypothetical protein DB29_02686 [Shouchella clausii]MDO7283764.1 hypothetical protein [Shouchella clausii]MDO7303860.1 hypothetical protein [Shouchella clausii]MDP0464512.1 hypothetical protein [Shouchella rhizosphaerae]MDP5255942.1 hypothetical protein [Shouchella clausii]